MFITQVFFFPNLSLVAPNLRDTVDYMYQKRDFAKDKRPPMRILWRAVVLTFTRHVAVLFILNQFLEPTSTKNALEVLQASSFAYRILWTQLAARKHHFNLQQGWIFAEMNWILIGMGYRYERTIKEGDKDDKKQVGVQRKKNLIMLATIFLF